MRPVCDVCGAQLTRAGWRGPVAQFRCSNTECSDFGKRIYTVHEGTVESSEHDPDRKEGSE